ncbi:MAG TPA: D-2-hydroxyacid dehydrogenase [Pirellulales bacterium]|nr:D-2-hydroxyacid dehydrogenase [Pirellulales bacterium]
MRIVLCYPVEPRHVAQIQSAAPQAEICDAGQEGVARELFACDIFCGHPKVPVDWDGVVRGGRLKWIQSSAAGLDHLLAPSVVESPIIISSASGVLSDQVAEHTVALVTGLLRGLPTFFRAQQNREYIRRPTRDLHHCTVGIVGLGGVGRRVAELFAPFKTRILATDLYPVDKPPHVAELWPADRLGDLLAAVDVLVLCVPLTDQTRWMINDRALAKLKPGAVLANMARGKLVVENDLVAALESGRLFGAVLDVAAEEPLPPESKLWELPNVIITPHVAGQSRWRIDNMTDFFCENLRRYLAGKPLVNLVDKRLGFPVRKAER